jgi:hypothetical protein
MIEFTIQRGSDGFGSQMITSLIAYLWATENDKTFYYLPLPGIILANGVGEQNQELFKLNMALKKMWSRLGIQRCKHPMRRFYKPKELFERQPFTFATLPKLHGCWPISHTNNKKTLSIHIRMGDDVVPENRIRCQPIKYYNDLIRRCLERFPDHTIQLISWREPDIDEDLKSKVVIDSSKAGGEILDHYTKLIHSDILIIGSSSFSMSAGLLNSGIVLCDKEIIGISPRYPKQWNRNFEELLG